MLFRIDMNFYVPFFNCCQIPQLNCKFKGLTVIPQRMILLVKIILKVNKGKFSRTIKCLHMPVSVWIGLPVCEVKRHVFPCSVSNSYLLGSYSSSMGAQTTVPPKKRFFFISIQLKLRNIPNNFLKQVLESYDTCNNSSV